MSGHDEELALLAAEYVLGTLDADAARTVAARAEHEPALRALIEDWERRLAPLSALADPVAPPPALWTRLAASIAPRPSRRRTRVIDSIAFWRGATAAGFALAAALAAIVFLRSPPGVPVAALVPPNGAPAAFIAEVQPDGRLRLIPLAPVRVAQGKALELWALPPGATRPVSLGVIPASGNRVAPTPSTASGTQIMVSLEPAGGSPTGLPTGPVLYAGTVQAAD